MLNDAGACTALRHHPVIDGHRIVHIPVDVVKVAKERGDLDAAEDGFGTHRQARTKGQVSVDTVQPFKLRIVGNWIQMKWVVPCDCVFLTDSDDRCLQRKGHLFGEAPVPARHSS